MLDQPYIDREILFQQLFPEKHLLIQQQRKVIEHLKGKVQDLEIDLKNFQLDREEVFNKIAELIGRR